MTKATQTKSDQVLTQVKPESQSRFGAGAWRIRFTWSSGHGAIGSTLQIGATPWTSR